MTSMERQMDYVTQVLKTLRDKKFCETKDVLKAIEQHNDNVQRLKYCEDTQKTSGKARQDRQDRQDKQSEEIDRLKFENEELKNRLSQLAGQKLLQGNPGITDLSDSYRPTKIAEYFNSLYDNEWNEAYEEIEARHNAPTQAEQVLVKVIQDIDEFCKVLQIEQLNRTKHYVKDEFKTVKMTTPNGIVPGHIMELNDEQEKLLEKHMRDLQKSLAIVSAASLPKIYYHASPMTKTNYGNGFNLFVKECLKYVWLMKVQDPPMVLYWAKEGGDHDGSRFKHYTQRGSKVHYNVWPALLLHHEGPIMTKGVVQGR